MVGVKDVAAGPLLVGVHQGSIRPSRRSSPKQTSVLDDHGSRTEALFVASARSGRYSDRYQMRFIWKPLGDEVVEGLDENDDDLADPVADEEEEGAE